MSITELSNIIVIFFTEKQEFVLKKWVLGKFIFSVDIHANSHLMDTGVISTGHYTSDRNTKHSDT